MNVIHLVLLLLFVSNYALSSENLAHVHGEAELTIAMEDGRVEVNLLVPAESVLGFEHRATTAADIAKVQEMKEYFSRLENVILFSGGECQVDEVDIDTGNIIDKGHDTHTDHHGHSHAEVSVYYKLNCPKKNALKSASLPLFNHYKTLEKIHAMWITAKQQGAAELVNSSTSIVFR